MKTIEKRLSLKKLTITKLKNTSAIIGGDGGDGQLTILETAKSTRQCKPKPVTT